MCQSHSIAYLQSHDPDDAQKSLGGEERRLEQMQVRKRKSLRLINVLDTLINQHQKKYFVRSGSRTW